MLPWLMSLGLDPLAIGMGVVATLAVLSDGGERRAKRASKSKDR